MSYQFSLDQSNRSLRFPVLVMAGIFSAVIGAYTFAACNERTPDQAAAGEAVVSKPGGGQPVSSEQPGRGITRPVRFENADSADLVHRYADGTAHFKNHPRRRPEKPW